MKEKIMRYFREWDDLTFRNMKKCVVCSFFHMFHTRHVFQFSCEIECIATTNRMHSWIFYVTYYCFPRELIKAKILITN
jgi:hypothetical protein